MKRKASVKIISAVLAFVMVILMIPLNVLPVFAIEEVYFSDKPSQMLGTSFNALSNQNISTETINPQNWIDYDKSQVYVFGDGERVLEQYSNATFAKSSLELLNKFGLDYSNTTSAKFSLNRAKAGIENKFSTGVDLSTMSTTSELYYYYTYKAVYNRYVLKSDYSNYLSDDFLNAVKNIDANSDMSIASFFQIYGTHMLTEFEMGGELQLSVWAISEEEGATIDATIENKITSNVGFGSIASASVANEIKFSFSNSTTMKDFKTGTSLKAYGGNSVYVDTTDSTKITLDKSSVERWVDELGEKEVFLPSSSKWIAVWEILPAAAEYEEIRVKLYDYFVRNSSGSNADFVRRFCSFSNRVKIAGYDYIAPSGYASQNVPYESINYIEPGAIISIDKAVDDSVFDVDSISYEVDKSRSNISAEIDRNGIIKVDSTAENGEKLVLYIKSGDITIRTVEFEIKKSGKDLFAGGYGTEKRPYLISTPVQFLSLLTHSELNDEHFMLTNDIDMSSIGTFARLEKFSGVFDGNGYSIYGFSSNLNCITNGIFGSNSGIIKNLTVGKAGITAFNGYSVSFSSYVNENYGTRGDSGILVGKNESDGVIDNCKVVNAYIYGSLADTNNNITAEGTCGGLVGRNYGYIVRCTSAGNSITYEMPSAVNSGDDNKAHCGGIVGCNDGGIVKDSISYSNTVHAIAHGDGKSGNHAYPVAASGGIAGYNGGLTGKISSSVAFNNCITVYASEGKYTHPSCMTGGIVGGQWDGGSSTEHSYTTEPLCWAIGNNSSYNNLRIDTIEELNSLYADNSNFTVDSNGYLSVSNVSEIKTENIKSDYVIGDIFDILNGDVCGTTEKDGSQFKEFDKNTSEYKSIFFNNFKVSGFSSLASGVVQVKLVSYSGKETTVNVNIAPITVERIEIETPPYKTSYYEGEGFSSIGLSIKEIYNNGETKSVTSGFSVSGFDTHKIGNSSIGVSYKGFTEQFDITVYRVKPSAISVSSMPQKTAYVLNEAFDISGLGIEVEYNNGITEVITSGFDCSGFSSAEEGTKTVTVSYTFRDLDVQEDVTLNTEFTVNVGTVSSVKINTLPEKTTYYTSDTRLDLSGLSLEVTYSNGAVKTVDAGYSVPYGYDLNKSGIQNVNIAYSGATASFEINVIDKRLESIKINHLPKTQYYLGETMTASGLSITRIYNDGTTSDVWNGYTVMVEGYDEGALPKFISTGTRTVTVYYAENGERKSTQYEINIAPVRITRIEIAQFPYKTEYKQNEEFKADGIVVNAVFNSGRVEEITDYYVTYDFSVVGISKVTVWYDNMSATFDAKVFGPSKLVISKLPVKTNYFIGDTLDLTGMEAHAVYFDGTFVNLTADDLTAEAVELDSIGTKNITVEYQGLTSSLTVDVNEFEVPDEAPKIIIEDKKIITGKTVTVNISLLNNPGIASLKLNVEFDTSILTLVDIKYNNEIGGQSQMPQNYNSPVILNWINGTADTEGDFVFATLTFEVSESASVGSTTNIKVTYNDDDIYDITETNVKFYEEGGVLQIIDYTPGDMNGDDEVNNKDLTRLFQYLSGWDVEINESAIDINGDGEINNKDLTRLFQYMSGWDVKIS